MSSCPTRRHVFLCHKKPCLLVTQNERSSCDTSRRVFLCLDCFFCQTGQIAFFARLARLLSLPDWPDHLICQTETVEVCQIGACQIAARLQFPDWAVGRQSARLLLGTQYIRIHVFVVHHNSSLFWRWARITVLAMRHNYCACRGTFYLAHLVWE